ncbi:MAG: flippase-like domain-containing protein [Flavobacteriales bacterium]|nr:flippase-like domain-containing protein [Flavobacteriales bacterium]
MKKFLIASLKIFIPLGLGLFLIWMVYKDLSPTDIEDIKSAFSEMNYGFIVFSSFIGLLSHISRAWRWKYPLNEMGYNSRFWNSFHTIMIGYFANLGIPRSGEIMRCGLMSKYENIPLTKIIGTVIAERVADLVVLCSLIFLVFLLQLETLSKYAVETGLVDKFSPKKIVFILSVFVLFSFLGLLLLRKSNHKIALKIREIIGGIYEGLKTIFTMKERWWYLAHTLLIWALYLLMFYVTFFSLPAVENIPFTGVLTGFVMGGIAVTVTNGGIGAYPLAVSGVLAIYGISQSQGYAFGWVVWTGQTVMLILAGLLSMLILPRINKD